MVLPPIAHVEQAKPSVPHLCSSKAVLTIVISKYLDTERRSATVLAKMTPFPFSGPFQAWPMLERTLNTVSYQI